MKPAGRERDIEIAELKKNKNFKCYVDGKDMAYDECVMEEDNCEEIHECRYASSDKKPDDCEYWKPIKEWSVNRNNAWELWDELIAHDLTLEFYQDGANCYLEVNFGDRIYGKDFADCVSQAWITWKETLKEATR